MLWRMVSEYQVVQGVVQDKFGAWQSPAPMLTDGLNINMPCKREKVKIVRGLFRRFAKLQHNEQAIIGFANRFGYLGTERIGHTIPVPEDGNAAKQLYVMEPTLYWCTSIRDMRLAVELWDILRDGRTDDLAKLVRWEENDREPFVGYESLERVMLPNGTSQSEVGEVISGLASYSAPKFEPGQIIKPAWYLLQRWINKHISESSIMRLLWHEERLVFHAEPVTLLAEMWKQLAVEVASFEEGEPVKTAMCQRCGKEFTAKRKSARFCTNTCRSQAHRADRIEPPDTER